MALEENKCSTEIDLEILEKLQNIEYNVSMNSKVIESIKNELSHIKNGFKDDLIARLLDTLEIQRKDKKEIRTKIIDWIIKLTMSGGLIYMVISSFLKIKIRNCNSLSLNILFFYSFSGSNIFSILLILFASLFLKPSNDLSLITLSGSKKTK
jgi:hypothetical protein